MVDCSLSYGNNGCINGFYGFSLEFAIKNKIALEDAYPYRGSQQPCKQVDSGYKIVSYLSFNGNDCSFLQNLLMLRPVIVSLDGNNFYWQFYSSGVLNYCGENNNLNHGVQVVGVKSFSNGSEWWIAKNSWGTDWGQKGFIRLDKKQREGNICKICSYIYHSQI